MERTPDTEIPAIRKGPGKIAAWDNVIFGNTGTPHIVLTEAFTVQDITFNVSKPCLSSALPGVEKLSEIRRWKHCFMHIASSHFHALLMFP
jgi:hypothetical protein